MREILFRGKRTDNGRWVEGYLIADTEFAGKPYYHTYIVNHKSPSGCFGGDIFIEVLPETVSQYTGLTDKNGIKIFEGDIISFKYSDSALIIWDDDARFAMLYDESDETDFSAFGGKDVEVIGNVHDNPELLDGAM